jgi:hypothetical protein
MAVEADINATNPKTRSLRKQLDEEKDKVTLGCQAIDLLATEKYPPQDLINCIKTGDKKIIKTR